jgi:phosphoribosylamine--glycine ligase
MTQDGFVVGIIGKGAREHALYKAVARSTGVSGVVVMPGNGGIPKKYRESVDITDFDAVLAVCKRREVKFLIVGPEMPLVRGIVDYMQKHAPYIIVFGPSREAAMLEGDKVFCLHMADMAGVPVPAYTVAHTMEEAWDGIDRFGMFSVVKAKGLCAGKGVSVADCGDDAMEAARQSLVDRVFGDEGVPVIIQERLFGREVSMMYLCDGEQAVEMKPARDYKQRHKDGPMTGGMGAVSPVDDISDELAARIKAEIVDPMMRVMLHEGKPFRGILYAGIMVTREGNPYLLEINVRFGDPEVISVLSLLRSDLVRVLLACCAGGTLSRVLPLRWREDEVSVAVVMAAETYPEGSSHGEAMHGLHKAEELGARIYHAGTKELEDGTIVTDGGRILVVEGIGHDVHSARVQAYAGVGVIDFKHHRRADIGLLE